MHVVKVRHQLPLRLSCSRGGEVLIERDPWSPGSVAGIWFRVVGSPGWCARDRVDANAARVGRAAGGGTGGSGRLKAAAPPLCKSIPIAGGCLAGEKSQVVLRSMWTTNCAASVAAWSVSATRGAL
jgi:hypothetical protein